METRRRSFMWFLRYLAWQSLWISITVACFRNVFWDTEQLEQMASRAACEAKPGCYPQMTRVLRTPISHSYQFVAAGRQVEVECMRAYIAVGEYACKEKGSGEVTTAPAPASPSTSATAPAKRASVPKK